MENENIPSNLKPLSPWDYFGYQLLFAIPVIGIISLIVFAFNNDNINRRNYARSFFCTLILVIIMIAIISSLGIGIGIANFLK